MIKRIALLFAVVLLNVAFAGELPNPDEDNLANFHLLDETCSGQCHQEEKPSEDLEFEFNSCVECHDSLSNLDGPQHNIKHQESEGMECVECHFPHEEFDPKEICTDCHDEGGKALGVMHREYSGGMSNNDLPYLVVLTFSTF
ncbi:cytochrome c3 family protein [Photobacterium sanguinicancri]|uniref:cytochrome c3 family protein n=1 Tax=Photobacterium sanguinicancri TaxID=875932 RepID=UPI0026E24E79|nr:cytochrome c3 family protein [Photobacterium sanguinicancri]MDO6497499.1 cytochrome c3 family protein [Photobacterium sanguinicancri]